MVREARLDLRPVDRLLLAYLGFVTVVILARGSLLASGTIWLIVVHLLIATLILLCARSTADERLGNLLHDFYPLILLLPLYTEIGVLNAQLGVARVLQHDQVVQSWEYAIFHGQPSYELIRRYPSVFLSGLLHVAYFTYYAVLLGGPLLLGFTGRRAGARRVLFTMMVAFVCCYVPFVLYPVAGPYYAFPHPSGPVREVWSAKLVYATLVQGSSMGAAFPSSHVAATLGTTLAVRSAWRGLGNVFAVFALLLTVGVVYCQMHYAVDAAAGIAVGVAAWLVGTRPLSSDPA